ncbi:AAA family ATPase, partial [Pseudomonas sp. MF6751]|nr:AAA family ATPase [Pseudomonas sp. MF6751]
MITELNINGVASYKSKSILSPTRKTSLIYGLNGAGKSTISEFLYNQSEPRFAKCSVKLSQPCDFLVYNQSFLNDYFYEEDNLKGRRPRKLSATPDLSGTVLPLCPIPNSASKSAPSFNSVKLKASA